MKRFYYFAIMALVIAFLIGCNSNSKTPQYRGCFDLSSLDTTVSPGTDFYQYACGGWMKNNPLRAEHSRFGAFDSLASINQTQVRGLIEELSAGQHQVGSVAQKIGDLYRIGMDTAKIEQQGVDPIKAELESIAQLVDKNQILAKIADMHHNAIFPLFIPYVASDKMNSDMNIVNLYQGGIGMTDRDYYLNNDERTAKIRAEYQNNLVKMFVLAGFSDNDAAKNAQSTMKIETELAKAAYSRVDLRNPHLSYNPKTIDELQQLAPAINWNTYFNALGLTDLKSLNAGQVPFIEKMSHVLQSASVDEMKAYLSWNLIRGAASYLNNAIAEQNFDFYGRTLSGRQEMQPRWKRLVNVVNGSLGEAVGEMYVAKHFPPASKQRMLELVGNLQASLKDQITGLSWMSDSTKQKGLEKLATFRVKIGYPDKWRDYSALEIKDDSYWANIVRSNRFDMDYMFAKAGKAVDRDEWLMNPQEVNAYYNPTTNEICFPAGILQSPFFFAECDDALNYGAIGVVIGHEMTHGFDDQGRKFDKDGNLKEWWTAEDSEKFNKRADLLVEYFDNIFVLDTVRANGRYTLGENIADQSGLILSYNAFQKALAKNPVNDKIDGFTPAQRFFLAYAGVWAGNIREQEILRLTKEDEHSLGRWRVNGALPHLQQFIDAFGIKEGEPMFLPKDKQAIVW